jgi:hypothetical protein
MSLKHAWDRVISLTGDLLKGYHAVQPYIQQAISSGGTQINTSPIGKVMEYVTTVNGEQIVVRAIELADGAIQITDAWVKTQ